MPEALQANSSSQGHSTFVTCIVRIDATHTLTSRWLSLFFPTLRASKERCDRKRVSTHGQVLPHVHAQLCSLSSVTPTSSTATLRADAPPPQPTIPTHNHGGQGTSNPAPAQPRPLPSPRDYYAVMRQSAFLSLRTPPLTSRHHSPGHAAADAAPPPGPDRRRPTYSNSADVHDPRQR